ncbi:signal peptidase I [Streptomyces gossypii]|uniref:signal peptidase I n=1 Tax=Streptomyces gossypii TaxID=2883101 RepID=UPI0035CD2A3A
MAVGAQSGSGDPEGEDSGARPDRSDGGPAAEQGEPAEPGRPGGPEGPGGPEKPGGPSEEAGGPRRGHGRGKPKTPRSFWKELPLLIGVALILALVIKTFLLQAFSIPSNSMQDTLQVGDRVLVDKLTPWLGSEPERGEVVVFHDPGGWLPDTETDQNFVQKAFSFVGLMPSADDKDLIKRVIGVGGDTVECKRGGKVMVNGKPLDEPYLFPGDTPCDDKPFGPVKVADGHMWVMGDHRQDSLDSRYHQNKAGGAVPVKEAVGRAVVVAWPLNRLSTLPVPDTFAQSDLAAKAANAAPAALGLAGALPLVMWRRRRRHGRTAETPVSG